MTQNAGVFITIEGPEGAGKSTQIELLEQYLTKTGRECVVTREPGGTPMAEQLRQVIKHHAGDEPVYDETELLLIEAARAQHVRHLIIPALKRGAVVLCDRFYDSTTAYQGFARGMDMKAVEFINKFAVAQCRPDLTLLLDIDYESGVARTSKRESTRGKYDRFEREAAVFHDAVRQGFLQIAEADPARVKVVSALDSPDNIHRRIMELVNNVI